MTKFLYATFAFTLIFGASALLAPLFKQSYAAQKTMISDEVKNLQLANKHEEKGHDHHDHAHDGKEKHDHDKHKDDADHKPHHDEKGHKHKDGDEHEGHNHKDHGEHDESKHDSHKHDHKEKSDHKAHHGEKGHKHKDGDEHEGHNHKDHGKHDESKLDSHGHEHKVKSDREAHHGEKGHNHKDGDENKEHGAHDENKHDAHEHGDKVKLSNRQMQEFGIQTDIVEKGDFSNHLKRPAEVKFDQDRVAHIVSRVPGFAREVFVSQGDKVSEKQLIAVLESRELADARANYIATAEREVVMRNIFEREEKLWEKKIARLREFLETKKKYHDIKVDKRSSAEKILALGFEKKHLEDLVSNKQANLSEYRLTSPFSGTVIERHVTRGEAVTQARQVFVIADLSRVWVDVSVYPKDLPLIQKNQKVHIIYDGGEVDGKIAFITPHVNETTRTATARIIVENPSKNLRPGMFLEVQIEIQNQESVLRVPKDAVQNSENGKLVFVGKDGEFSPRQVKIGRENHKFVEVLSGLKSGETYVKQGAFTLKAQLAKGSFDDGHNH